MIVDPTSVTATVPATLLRATAGAGEVTTGTFLVKAVTQVLVVTQQPAILVIELVLSCSEIIITAAQYFLFDLLHYLHSKQLRSCRGHSVILIQLF